MSKYIIESLKRRLLQQNGSVILCLVGPTGGGKSWSALRLAELIQPNFPTDASSVYFKIEDMIEAINSGEHKRGDVLILDESGVAGAGWGSRKWFSEGNVQMSNLFQTIRCLGFCTIFCLPNLEFMDSHGRALIHSLIECQHVDRRREVVWVKWKNLQRNYSTKKVYAKYPFEPLCDGNSGSKKLKACRIHRPSSEELINNYESRKMAFVKELTQAAVDSLKQKKEESGNKLDAITKRREIEVELMKGKLKPSEIATKFNVTRGYVSQIRHEFSLGKG